MANLWNHEEPISSYEHDDHATPDVPPWIEQDVSPSDVAAIVQGGCDSGAYMPAVSYHQAVETMAAHGDKVFEYIENATGEEPCALAGIASCTSWSGLACLFVSTAVELWAASVEPELDSLLEAIEEGEDD